MSLKKYWNVFWFCRKVAIMKMMEYRGDFIFWTIVSTIWTLFNILFYFLIIRVNQGVAGWTLSEMLLLLGVFNTMDAIIWSFFYGSMRMYTTEVFSGEITFSLLKPIDAQFFLMTRYNSFSNIFRLAIGVGLIIWTVVSNHWIVTLPAVLVFLATFSAGLLFFYSIWFMVSTIAFWVEKLDNVNDAFPGIRSVFQVPHQVYTGISSTVLTVLLPLGLIGSVPSEFLLGRGSYLLATYLIIFSLVALGVSRWFFFFSIKRYSGIAN